MILFLFQKRYGYTQKLFHEKRIKVCTSSGGSDIVYVVVAIE